MKYAIQYTFAVALLIIFSCYGDDQLKIQNTRFAVIGAGAGSLVVGLLLDLGLKTEDIVWVDPEFKVGRLGQYYQNVVANAKTKIFIEFLQGCKTFGECSSPAIDRLYGLDLEQEYDLKFIVEALQDITTYLRSKIISLTDYLIDLQFDDNRNGWIITLKSGIQFFSTNVVLATGSHPRTLDYEECKNIIPLDEAIDPYKLPHYVNDQDTVAVVGSAHSAILLLKYLSELSVPRVFNFYTTPIVYPTPMEGGWVLHESTGLMGMAAQWAKEVLEKNPPAKIIRLGSTEEMLKTWLPLCTKVIYAAGFERNELPAIPGLSYDKYDTQTGRIGIGLYGIGIAFPREYTDPLGNVEKEVGLLDFMEHALLVVPNWVQQRDISLVQWKRFSELFSIVTL